MMVNMEESTVEYLVKTFGVEGTNQPTCLPITNNQDPVLAISATHEVVEILQTTIEDQSFEEDRLEFYDENNYGTGKNTRTSFNKFTPDDFSIGNGIRRRIISGLNESEALKIMTEEWPKDVFQTTSLKKKSFTPSEAKTKVFITREDDPEDPVFQQFLRLFPSLHRAGSMGRFTTIRNTETTINEFGEQWTDSKQLLYCRLDEEDKDRNVRVVEYLEIAKFIQGLSVENGEVIELICPATETFMLRKALEITFIGAEAKVTICSRKYLNTSKAAPPILKENVRKPRQGEILIQGEGRSFPEISKALKENANPEKTGVEIAGIQQLESGNVRIKVIGGSKKAEDLYLAIKDTIEGVTVQGSDKTTLHVNRLEKDCTKEDIIEGVRKALRKPELVVEVTSIRPAFGSSAKASVVLGRDEAKDLVALDRVVIGIISVRFVKREEKCVKCWDNSHPDGDCKGPDRSKECFKCHKNGHMMRDCTEPPGLPRL